MYRIRMVMLSAIFFSLTRCPPQELKILVGVSFYLNSKKALPLLEELFMPMAGLEPARIISA